jgi:hypothetical protein
VGCAAAAAPQVGLSAVEFVSSSQAATSRDGC